LEGGISLLKRIIASVTFGSVLIAGALVAPAQANRQAGSGTDATRPRIAARPTPSTVRRLPNLQVYPSPVLAYTSKTCVINFNNLMDNEVVNSVTGCGVKVRFSVPMMKLTVPGTFNNWGSPPDTETATPRVLWTQLGVTEVVLTYSARSRIVGVEAEQNPFGTSTIDATFRRQSGASLGTISRDITAPSGARLFAGKAKSPTTTARIKTVTLSSDVDFVIARIRVVRP
jgi:hypothetical protein